MSTLKSEGTESLETQELVSGVTITWAVPESSGPQVRPDIPLGEHWAVLVEEPLEYYVLAAGYESRNVSTTKSTYIAFESREKMDEWILANISASFVVLSSTRYMPVVKQK